ncbi:S-adenosyl-L-methionine-dependent methyltransferase [Stipitochalara longipes BDJ]|nr:S-adenosyl-L-methionine-dependent methyltransferase [Stipitochalara longipes BDJ]
MPSPVAEAAPASPPARLSPPSAEVAQHDPVAAEITNEHSALDESISSSVRDYNFEYGRRYHKYKEGYYVFPNDESEQDREDMKHAMIVNLCGGKLHFAPIGQHPQNIIDLGTGTGIWYLSPIQPEWVPPNVKFMVEDAQLPWLEPENFYDLVHGRHITPTLKNFPALIERAFKHIKPGGWIKFKEMHYRPHCDDDTMTSSYPFLNYHEVVTEGLDALGIHFNATREEAANLEKYGFTNVQHEVLKVPLGPWAKHKTLKLIGLYLRTSVLLGLDGMSFGPLYVYLVDIRKSIMDSSIHVYFPYHITYGQSPLET